MSYVPVTGGQCLRQCHSRDSCLPPPESDRLGPVCLLSWGGAVLLGPSQGRTAEWLRGAYTPEKSPGGVMSGEGWLNQVSSPLPGDPKMLRASWVTRRQQSPQAPRYLVLEPSPRGMRRDVV